MKCIEHMYLILLIFCSQRLNSFIRHAYSVKMADITMIINVVNRNETEAVASNIEIQSGSYTRKAKVNMIDAESLEARNTGTEQPVNI